MSHNMGILVKSTNNATDPLAFAENLDADKSTNFAKAADFSAHLIWVNILGCNLILKTYRQDIESSNWRLPLDCHWISKK